MVTCPPRDSLLLDVRSGYESIQQGNRERSFGPSKVVACFCVAARCAGCECEQNIVRVRADMADESISFLCCFDLCGLINHVVLVTLQQCNSELRVGT